MLKIMFMLNLYPYMAIWYISDIASFHDDGDSGDGDDDNGDNDDDDDDDGMVIFRHKYGQQLICLQPNRADLCNLQQSDHN